MYKTRTVSHATSLCAPAEEVGRRERDRGERGKKGEEKRCEEGEEGEGREEEGGEGGGGQEEEEEEEEKGEEENPHCKPYNLTIQSCRKCTTHFQVSKNGHHLQSPSYSRIQFKLNPINTLCRNNQNGHVAVVWHGRTLFRTEGEGSGIWP